VRITSHGCSGTVIESAEGRSLILSCAHAFRGTDAQKAIVLDVPWPNDTPATPRKTKLRLRAIDAAADLTLIEVSDGPYPFVAPWPRRGFGRARTSGASGMTTCSGRRPGNRPPSSAPTTLRPTRASAPGTVVPAAPCSTSTPASSSALFRVTR
jgi:hypothetical protein